MLLGFGLDAYICLGTILEGGGGKKGGASAPPVEREFAWVVTIGGGRGGRRMMGYDPVTGHRSSYGEFVVKKRCQR